MQKHVGYLGALLALGSSIAAVAQTPSVPTPITKYDGTYLFVSSAKVNETFTTMRTEHPRRCPDLQPRTALTIVNGQVRFNQQQGTIGPNGKLSTRLIAPIPSGGAGAFPGTELPTYGRIDENGTIRIRRIGWGCSYDFVWQKQPKSR
jgi:hypothetical protein